MKITKWRPHRLKGFNSSLSPQSKIV